MTPDDVARFRKILGLLGSDQVGERAAAALKATEFLATHGLSWSDVTLPVSGPDVLAQRRQTMDATMKQHAWRAERDSDEAIRAANEAKKNAAAARKAAWAQARYGADEDGFETGRK